MKTHTILSILFIVSALASAGDLNPPGAPTGTMRTLNEIYAAAFEPVSVPSLSQMSPISDGYLYISGIPGDSNDPNHLDWIDIVGYTFHIENGAEPKADPYPKFSNLLIAKYLDKASVPLMLKTCDNTCLDQVILERCFPVGENRTFYRLTLTNARVTYISPASAVTVGFEVLAIGSFDTIKLEYYSSRSGIWLTEQWDVGKDGGES